MLNGAWKANIRVGEALTKDRKSSAAASEGLVDMVRAQARDNNRVLWDKARRRADSFAPSRCSCSGRAVGIGLGGGSARELRQRVGCEGLLGAGKRRSAGV